MEDSANNSNVPALDGIKAVYNRILSIKPHKVPATILELNGTYQFLTCKGTPTHLHADKLSAASSDLQTLRRTKRSIWEVGIPEQLHHCLSTFDFDTLKNGWKQASDLASFLGNISQASKEAKGGLKKVSNSPNDKYSLELQRCIPL